MRESELERLVNDELDGVATPEQAARLKALLAEDESHRARYRDMRVVFSMLHRVEVVEPPANLKENVLRAIQYRTDAARPRQGLLTWLGAAFRRRPGFGLGYSFALGAVVGAVALGLVTGRLGTGARDRNADFSGSMLPPPSTFPFEVLDRARFDLEGCQVEALVRTREGGGVALELGIRSAETADVHVRFDPGRLAPTGFRRWEARLGTVELRPGEFRVRHRGEGRYELLLDGSGEAAPLQIMVAAGDRSLERALRTRAAP